MDAMPWLKVTLPWVLSNYRILCGYVGTYSIIALIHLFPSAHNITKLTGHDCFQAELSIRSGSSEAVGLLCGCELRQVPRNHSLKLRRIQELTASTVT